MKKIEKILLSIVLMNFIFLTSCQKENLIDKEIVENQSALNQENKRLNSELTEEPNSFSFNYREVVWAIGANNRVFKSIDNGASWTEPNPAARLQQISCGNYAVWGVSYGRVYKWNGSYWFEPNANPSWGNNAKNITAIDGTRAWLVDDNGNVRQTYDGGINWTSVNGGGNHKEVASDYSNALAIMNNKEIYYYNPPSNKFEDYATYLNKARHISIGGGFNKYWAIGEYYNIYYSSDAVNWYEPNTSAYAYEITRGNTYTFVIGNSQRIFRSIDGVTWAEPNPAAGAFKISAGIEFY